MDLKKNSGGCENERATTLNQTNINEKLLRGNIKINLNCCNLDSKWLKMYPKGCQHLRNNHNNLYQTAGAGKFREMILPL